MNTLPVLETDVVSILRAARDGEDLPELEFTNQATVCKYAVPDGYPADPRAGAEVTIDPGSAGEALLFYASVDAREDGVYTTTSRSFAVVGRGETVTGAEAVAADAIQRADETGLRVRHDIGTADLLQARIDHVKRLRED